MKRFWLVLLSLGLIMAFSASAFAVDVKVSGEYYAAGLYLNKTQVADGTGGLVTNPSTAFYFQRLRVGTDFVVAPCLKLVTRFDAMERIWGGARSTTATDMYSAGTRAENENIAFDIAYIDYTSPIGLVQVGYMKDWTWGTIFGNKGDGPTAGQIKYTVPVGPVYIFAGIAKEIDTSKSAVTPSTVTDRDYDSYRLGAIYSAKGIEAGALLLYNRSAIYRAVGVPLPYLTNLYSVVPYAKAQVGPVAIQAEFNYTFGDMAKWENGVTAPATIGVGTMSFFLDATANLGMVNVGGSFAYLSGDDPGTTDKIEGGTNNAGLDWNPCLIMFNNDLVNYQIGGIAGHDGSQVGGMMSNAWFGQGRVGVKAMPALDINASLSYATADKKPGLGAGLASYQGGLYGWEVDITGTYKITNNLSYMLGVGYLFTGDYYKGFDLVSANKVTDDYILINKLTLNF